MKIFWKPEILLIPLDDIDIADENVRDLQPKKGLEDLKASILMHGLLQPIVVFPIGEGECKLSLFRSSDYARKKEKVSKTKLPTQLKSQVQYCRNCNCKNKDSAKTCVQCEITLKEPKLRKKMR